MPHGPFGVMQQVDAPFAGRQKSGLHDPTSPPEPVIPPDARRPPVAWVPPFDGDPPVPRPESVSPEPPRPPLEPSTRPPHAETPMIAIAGMSTMRRLNAGLVGPLYTRA
jgi:hypothetical protein